MSCQLGTWLSIGSPVVAELAAIAGFDWVLFDLEHGCASEAWLPDQLRALRGSKTQGIVRVSSLNCEQIARVLDWGADGVMIPRVGIDDRCPTIVDRNPACVSHRYESDNQNNQNQVRKAALLRQSRDCVARWADGVCCD